MRRFVPALLCLALQAQTPPPDFTATAQSLVDHYLEVLPRHAQLQKEAAQAKKRLPLQDSAMGATAAAGQEKDPQKKQVYLVARHFLVEATRPARDKVPVELQGYLFEVGNAFDLDMAAQLPPDSPALQLVAKLRPDFLGYLAWHSSGGGFVNQTEKTAAEKAFAWFDQAFEKNASREVKAAALVAAARLAAVPRIVPTVEAYTNRLAAFDPKHPEVAKLQAWLVQAKVAERTAPKVGNPVPDFKVPNFEKAGATFTPASFKGRYLLIDFWATWCGPCKNELPYLHRAYAAFHPKGLEVLSLSWDKKAADITTFRKNPATPMPWNHSFPQGELAKDLNARFDVRGIPHILLVSPEGKILAMDEELRGEKLEKTLAAFLQPQP